MAAHPERLERLRPADDELVGYLDVLDDGRAVPLTLLLDPLSEPLPIDEANRLLDARGLAALDRSWFALLPARLIGEVNLRETNSDWIWRRIVAIEVARTFAIFRPIYPVKDEIYGRALAKLPVDDLLHDQIPA